VSVTGPSRGDLFLPFTGLKGRRRTYEGVQSRAVRIDYRVEVVGGSKGMALDARVIPQNEEGVKRVQRNSRKPREASAYCKKKDNPGGNKNPTHQR